MANTCGIRSTSTHARTSNEGETRPDLGLASARDHHPGAGTPFNHPDGPPSSNPRGERGTHSTELTITHELEPFGGVKSTRKLNADILRRIASRLTAAETRSNNSWIYAFTFPAGHYAACQGEGEGEGADTTTLVKIGYTNNKARRMHEHRRRCHYAPRLLFDIRLPDVPRYEGIIHLQLHNERKRERGCPGCARQHQEWFKVDVEEARAITTMWRDWAETRPYDREGWLFTIWRRRLEAVDLDDRRCWEVFVYGRYVDDMEPVARESAERGGGVSVTGGRSQQGEGASDGVLDPDEMQTSSDDWASSDAKESAFPTQNSGFERSQPTARGSASVGPDVPGG